MCPMCASPDTRIADLGFVSDTYFCAACRQTYRRISGACKVVAVAAVLMGLAHSEVAWVVVSVVCALPPKAFETFSSVIEHVLVRRSHCEKASGKVARAVRSRTRRTRHS